MTISTSDIRGKEYFSEPNPNEYRGFKQIGTIKERGGSIKLEFSNGQKEFIVIGHSYDILSKAFDIIDSM